MIDVCFERSTSLTGKDYTSISLVVYDFSEKLLWSDLYTKIFLSSDEIIQKRQRIGTVRKAWNEHKKYFSNEYWLKKYVIIVKKMSAMLYQEMVRCIYREN